MADEAVRLEQRAGNSAECRKNPATVCGPILLPAPTSVVSLEDMLILATLQTNGVALPGIGSLFASDLVWNAFTL